VEGGGRRVVPQERRRQLAAEVPDIAGELGEAEIDEPAELAHTVAKILDQAIAEPHELAQLLGGPIRQAARRRALLGGEAGDPQGIDGIGLRALQLLASEAPGGSGFNSATAKPAATRAANRFFQ
jgi:hypothetical protein